jgi:hypothetical protein
MTQLIMVGAGMFMIGAGVGIAYARVIYERHVGQSLKNIDNIVAELRKQMRPNG